MKMGAVDLSAVLNGIPKKQIAYEVIIESCVEPLFVSRKLKSTIYTKIKNEVDVLRKKQKKNNESKVPDHNVGLLPTSGTPEVENPKRTTGKNYRQGGRSSGQHQGQYSNQRQYQHPGQHRDQYPTQSRDQNFGELRSQFSRQNKMNDHVEQRHTVPATNEPYDRHSEKHPEKYLFELEAVKETNRRLEKDMERLNAALVNARDDAINLRTRLSKIAGDQLKTNNPNIADLSDQYRPTNLGQQFSELYDNEWSDAYEEVQRIIQDETKSIGLLHQTVKHAFSSCERKAKRQEEKIKDILLDVEEGADSAEGEDRLTGMDNLHNVLIDIRKKILPTSSVNVAKNYWREEFCQMSTLFDIGKPGKKLMAFALKCAQLCWCMNMCDPPMGMSHNQNGQAFDKNSFREYTRSVKTLKQPVVEFFVWPALYLNVGGHMVSKGVAQPHEGGGRRK